ncbi:MAG TPA: hypothetical protein VGG56_12305 [Terracidiphilus sp.]|jgi:hypothetical protein
MTNDKDGRKGSSWWLLLYAAITAVCLFLAVIAVEGFDVDAIFYTFVGVPLISLVFGLVLLATSIFRKRKPERVYLLIFPVYWVISAALFMNASEIRLRAQWLLHSHKLKASIQMQPAPNNGELRHAEFDGAGWAGMDTVEYLVFDPTDLLTIPISNHSKGRFPGIPCEVPMIRRMDRSWYVVTYYTNAEWNKCA